LRSQAEELETGKEELQSINEELTTVNEELKNKIDELSHAHSDFHNLMSATDIGTIFLDRDLRVKFFTPPTRNVINIIHSDTNRKLSDLTHKFKDRNLISDIEIVLETLQVVEREIETSDGKWYLIRILPYRAADDRINGVALTFIDTTRRKMAEDALRESYERMNEILESINDAFYAVDCDFNFTYINRKAEEIWGRERETLIGKQYWKEFPEVVGSESYKMHHKALAEQRAIHYETVSPVLKRWIDVSIYPDSRGGLSCYFRDVTERKEAEDALRQNEERMRLLVESVMDYAIFSTNPDGFIENWNPGAERMFGYTEKEAIGQNCAMIFTPEDQAANVPDAERKVAREEGRAADERWHMRKDKTRFYVSGVQTPLFDKDGNLTGFVKVARDMTEKIEADDKLARAHNELENKVQERTRELKEANKALRAEVKERKQAEEQRIQLLHQIVTMQEDERRRIARDLHDQLGQQLTGLRLMLENIRKECAELQICDQVAAAQAIAAQLDTDVDFLAWELRPAALDDLGLKAAVANYVSEWSRHFNIPAEFHSSNIDRERLSPEAETNIYRICQEALNNIWKHAQATHVSVLLERRDGHIVLIVEDDGVGFNPKKKRKPDENDRGIGLIGMQERAALIGGALEIESAPKEGTTVFARVPLRKRKKKTIESHLGNGNS
jgi:PAS domain S-box-containing protein